MKGTDPHRIRPMTGIERKAAGSATWKSSQPAQLSEQEFKKFSGYIYDVCGIKLPPIKRTMLSARLNKRLRALGLGSFREYYDYLMSSEGQRQEMVRMIDVVTTNKTNFFREAKHFDYLVSHVLPAYVVRLRGKQEKLLRIWSAGCSSGEEPYTLAMVVYEFLLENPGFDFSILATDICTEVLAVAERAIYPDEAVAEVPLPFRQKYLMRGKDRQKGFHRVVPELRQKVTFQRLNFLSDDFGLDGAIDIIFCRNVIIYFDRRTQINLFKKFYRCFAPQGYLFTGHSETLEGLADKMERVSAAVYRCL